MRTRWARLGDDATDAVSTDGSTSVQADVLGQGEQWVQWAETAATSNSLDWSTKNTNTRYNLNQFWALKTANYATDPASWDALDLRAYKAWAAIAELGLVADNPPAQQKYADEAQQAYAGAIDIATRLGQSTASLQHNAGLSTAWMATAKAQGVDDSLKAAVIDRANQLMADVNAILGIPMWAWGLGAVGLLWLLYGRK